jgi:hypothetical protein
LQISAQVTRLGKNVLKLSEYISSNHYAKLKGSDLDRLDSLYLESLKITKSNYSESMLALTFAAIPYKVVPLKLPITKIRVNVPLISANDSIFRLKNSNLPGKLLYDSPHTNFGDKDKIAHFFGNAFLGYNTGIFDITKFLGIFVEDFEKGFKVESNVDPRDLEVNKLGFIFGKAVKKYNKLLPSQVFLIYLIFTKNAYEFSFSY